MSPSPLPATTNDYTVEYILNGQRRHYGAHWTYDAALREYVRMTRHLSAYRGPKSGRVLLRVRSVLVQSCEAGRLATR